MQRIWAYVGIALAVTLVVLIVLTMFLTPAALNPAYAAALDFADAVFDTRDDAAAMALLSPEMVAWVGENCPEGVTACIDDYIPDEWGGYVDTVYRRSVPDGTKAWDIQLIATFDERLTPGFSGVCIYVRAEDLGDSNWLLTRWSGWVSCAQEEGLDNLRLNPNVPNRAP